MLATQNPLEQEGTYPLPEAQLDRFLMQIDILYPELEAERRILLETTGVEDAKAENVLTPQRLKEIQPLIRRMPVPESVVEAILKLVRSARPGQGNAETDKHVAWGPGPRASQALTLCARARALYRRPLRAVDRRRPCARRTGPSAPHGAELCRARRRHDRARRHRPAGQGARLTDGAHRRKADRADRHPHALRPGAAARLSGSPDLLVEARRVVNTVIAGWHGRRKRGIGENFWQFRPYVDGDAMARIDWRRSARDDHTYVRDREWQAAHTVWLWADPRPPCSTNQPGERFQEIPRVGSDPRSRRTLSRSGERIAWPGLDRSVLGEERCGTARLASVPRR